MSALPLAVVVVNFASHDLLERNLQPLAAALPSAHVVVVDSWSGQAERDATAWRCQLHGWHLVGLGDNGGFGRGVNAGIARAGSLGARSFLVVNPDASIDVGSVRRLHAAVEQDPMTLAAPVVVDASGQLWSRGAYLYLDDGSVGSLARHDRRAHRPHRFWISGACFLVSDELWARLGGFDEDYFLYWEDVDLCVRAADVGARLVVDPTAVAVHEEGGTQDRAGARAKSGTYYYFNIRNRLLFATKHLDGPGVRRWLRTSPAVTRGVLLRGGRRQFLHSLGPLRAAARGSYDGWRLARRGPDRP